MARRFNPKDVLRTIRSPWISFADIRLSLRMLLKDPGYTAVAVLSIALGVGAGTAVFSLVNAILLRSLPVANPHQLRVLRWSGVESRVPSFAGHMTQAGDRHTGDSFSHPAFLDIREHCVGLADVFGSSPIDDVVVRTGSETFTASGTMVSDNFFSGLEVRPRIGRLLGAGEDFGGGARSVVISHSWWERHHALDPAVVGQSLVLNGQSFTIVGVLPQGFTGVAAGLTSELYVPMAAESPFLYRPLAGDFHWFVRLIARLKPGSGDAQLQAASEVVFARQANAIMTDAGVEVEAGNAGLTNERNFYRKLLYLMLGAVALVMLVACANLAGLSVARGAARERELALRVALGAGRWRLVRQSLTESALLALLGGGLGVVLSVWGTGAISRLLSGSPDGLKYDFSLDLNVLAFSLALVVGTALLSGLLPAWRAARVDPVRGLGSRGEVGVPRWRLGRALVAGQIGLSLLLLTGAGLYLRTLVNLASIDAGFSTDRLVLVQTNIHAAEYANAQPAEFYERVEAALAVLPGVKGAALVEVPLLGGADSLGRVQFSGRAEVPGVHQSTRRLTVGETFFSTLGIPMLRGRGFSTSDGEGATRVVVVNETFARKLVPDEDPLGMGFRMWEADWQIVGICRDAKYSNVKETVLPTAYFPFRQRFYSRFKQTHLRGAWFAVRTVLPTRAIVPAIRKAVAAIDADVAISGITTQASLRDTNLSQERLLAFLCTVLAGFALLLSCIGVFGLMAFHVARRAGEIAVRMALGATGQRVSGLILREALLLAVLGVAAGLPIALALGRLIKSQLYGVTPSDPTTLAATAVLLTAVAVLSAWIPAWRASKVDPMAVLKNW